MDFDEEGVELTVQGAVTTLHFTAMLHPEVRFGVTIAATSNGLLVTYVERTGAGHAQRVNVGDYLVRQVRIAWWRWRRLVRTQTGARARVRV